MGPWHPLAPITLHEVPLLPFTPHKLYPAPATSAKQAKNENNGVIQFELGDHSKNFLLRVIWKTMQLQLIGAKYLIGYMSKQAVCVENKYCNDWHFTSTTPPHPTPLKPTSTDFLRPRIIRKSSCFCCWPSNCRRAEVGGDMFTGIAPFRLVHKSPWNYPIRCFPDFLSDLCDLVEPLTITNMLDIPSGSGDSDVD